MAEVRPVTTPLAGHFKLASKQCPQSLVLSIDYQRGKTLKN